MTDAARPPVIAATGLSKAFRRYAHPRDILLEAVLGGTRHTEFRALDAVDLEIREGEIVGILGRNGAGKSTLLKLLAGTLEPSAGSARVRGRLSAILELGTGFHPDYNGRENALLGAICLGLSRREARAKLDAIIAFAELGEFIDQPFRTYSSGMQARLTFATALAADPEVLIVDEALSVGDARFQLRCFDRLRELRANGCTILFVTHSTEQVGAFCTRAIILERGKKIADGDPDFVTRAYTRLLFAEEDARATDARLAEGASRAFGVGGWSIDKVALLGEDGLPTRRLRAGERATLRFRATGSVAVADMVAGFLVRTPQGLVAYGTDTTAAMPDGFTADPARALEVAIRFTCTLAGGRYFASYGLARRDGTKLDYRYDGLDFEVERAKSTYDASIAELGAEIAIEPCTESAGRADQWKARWA